jgi:hypothetical protein
MSALRSIVCCAVLVGAQLTGCASLPQASTTRQLFDRIEIGMTREQVDSILGSPVHAWSFEPPPLLGEQEVWYLAPPKLEPVDSPFAEGSIGVTFHPDGRVVSKRLNPHVRER